MKQCFSKRYFSILLLFLPFFLFSHDHVVSFIIPCYNCASTVEESIQSIYQQNLPYRFEVICTNDGSTDATLQILNKCQQKYPHLYIYNHEHNSGGGTTRNTCVRHSKGDLIFCLDSDNILVPYSVVKLIALIDETGCDVASFEFGRAFDNNHNHSFAFVYSTPENHYDLKAWAKNPHRNPAYGGNYLFTRKSYDRAGGYPEDVGAADTFGFGLAQLATGSVMKTATGTCYWHRVHDDSYFVRETKNNNLHRLRVLKKHAKIFDTATQRILDEKNPDEVWSALEHGKFKLANHAIFQK